MECSWKPNWEETKQNFIKWWDHEGLVIGAWYGVPSPNLHDKVENPKRPEEDGATFTEPVYRAERNYYRLSGSRFVADVLPVAETDIGPGALALLLGGNPDFTGGTVWINPVYDYDDPTEVPRFEFDEKNKWWQTMKSILQENARLGRGKYITAMPDLVENIDILTSVRGKNRVMMDMLENPDWVKLKVAEINCAWLEAFDRIYDIVKLEDGSMATDDFRIWGPGRTAKIQCDASASISPDMFWEFIVPSLKKQCEHLDHAVYHLDGYQAICHLDAILELEGIQAVQWTPDPTSPSGGSAQWYGMYRQILEAGKSLEVVNLKSDEVIPLLDEVGGNGVYIIINSFTNEKEAEDLLKAVEPYRK